jgi:hypothetical protein
LVVRSDFRQRVDSPPETSPNPSPEPSLTTTWPDPYNLNEVRIDCVDLRSGTDDVDMIDNSARLASFELFLRCIYIGLILWVHLSVRQYGTNDGAKAGHHGEEDGGGKGAADDGGKDAADDGGKEAGEDTGNRGSGGHGGIGASGGDERKNDGSGRRRAGDKGQGPEEDDKEEDEDNDEDDDGDDDMTRLLSRYCSCPRPAKLTIPLTDLICG